MRKVEANDNVAFPRRRGDLLDIEQLTCEEVHAGKHHYRELICVFVDQIDDVFWPNREIVLTRPRENKRVSWVEAMIHDLRFDRIRVGRKRRLLQDRKSTRLNSSHLV